MSPRWTLRRTGVPDEAKAAITLAPGERLLSHGVVRAGGWVVASNQRLYAVDAAGGIGLTKPWHLVDAGSWDSETRTLTVTWVGADPDAVWPLDEVSMVPETLRERVQASVVLAERVPLPGKAVAKAAIRQDLATGELVPQVVLGPGVRSTDPGVADACRTVLADLKEQVGLV